MEDRCLLSVSPTIELFNASPALFVENLGQWADPSVRYAFQGSGANVLHTQTGPVIQLFQPEDATGGTDDSPMLSGTGVPPVLAQMHGQDARATPTEPPVVHSTQFSVHFEGANLVEPVGLDQAATVYNYFVGDQSNWRSAVPTFQNVGYQGLYDGIDLYTWGRRDSLKYEFHCAPGADYRQIQVQYQGTEGLALDGLGNLHVQTSLGELVDDAPYVYQEIGGRQVEVPARFEIVDGQSCRFVLTGDYDPSRELVIDPDLAWATFLGGTSDDRGTGIAVDDAGNALVTGFTTSSDFAGANNPYHGGDYDAFVAKVTPGGSLAWATYLGGSGRDSGSGIAVDGDGNALVLGYTQSSDLARANNSYHGGCGDSFVAKVTTGGSLAWATYLGGSGGDYDYGIAVDGDGNALVTGYTQSSDFAGANNSFHGGLYDVFVARVTTGGLLAWATYLGGSENDQAYGIAVDGAGNALVSGTTCSVNFAGANNSYHGGYWDAFVAKVTSGGSLAWATFLGGTSDDRGTGIAVDGGGNALVAGQTNSTDFAGANNSFHGGLYDVFVARVTTGGLLAWATYLGGSENDQGGWIAVDGAGNALVSGTTSSVNFAGANNSFHGEIDAFVAKVTSGGSLAWATYLGGTSYDIGYRIAVDGAANALVTGCTFSSDFAGANNSYHGGTYDAFVAKVNFDATPPTVTATSPSLAGGTLAAGTTSLAVTFSEPVVGGNVLANYQLQSLGADALLGTADDMIISLSPAYAGNAATLTFAALPASVYRLTVRDTITDAAGNKLDGDADGTPGGDWTADFVVLPPGDLFYSTPTYDSGGVNATSLAIGDLNGDGRADLAVANSALNGNVGVLLSRWGGTFETVATYSSGGNSPRSVAIGDVNGDGLLDLAVANYNSDSVGVLLGQLGGTFAAAATYSSGGRHPRSVAIGDLNGDGAPDLAVANANGNTVGVLLGQPGGTFAPAATYTSGGAGPNSVAIGDLNGDGRPDLAVANNSSDTVGVLLGQPGGTFAPAVTYNSGGSRPTSVAIGDLSGDGRPDLAVANDGSDNVGVLLGQPGGTLAPAVAFSSGGTLPRSVAIGDVSGDGLPDLAVANASSDGVGVLLGQPGGAFAPAVTYTSGGGYPCAVAIGDVSGDGLPDLAVANANSSDVGVLLGQPRGTFAAGPAAYNSGGDYSISVAIGDVSGDGLPDLAVANELSDTVGVLFGQPGGAFAPAATYSSGGSLPYSVAIGDLNGDGLPDLAVANDGDAYTAKVGVLLGQPGGTFAPAATYSSGGSFPHSVAIGDLNDDGLADLAVANGNWDTYFGAVGLLFGQPDGTFASAVTYYSGGNGPESLAIGDLNGDGLPDLAVANAWSDNVGVLLSEPGGTFAPAVTYDSGGDDPCAVAIGDLNGDGCPDLAVADVQSNNVGVLLGQPGGTFAPAATYNSGGINPNSVTIGDLNADGRPDLAVANFNSGNVGVLLGTSSGTFSPAATYGSGGVCPSSAAIADLNGDGLLDLAVVNRGGNVGVLLNASAFPLFSPNGMLFDVQPSGFMAGQLVQGTDNAFDGLNRLQVAGADYAPTPRHPNLQDGMRTLVLGQQTIAGLEVYREVTVPETGSEDFARTVDVFTNPTGNPITTTVRIVGNLGSDAATTVWKTSDGDTDIETTDQWIGTDDADGSGTPAIIHYIHGPLGLRPTSVVRTGDNIEWTYNLTVHAGETVRLANFTILSTTRAEAEAAANVLVTTGGFGGQAAAFLTPEELASLVNFDGTPPTADIVDVTPDPRTTAVASIDIVFSEPVYGLDWTDLTLSRNGAGVSLTTATFSTTDNITWTLGNLSGLTGTVVGNATTTYHLTLTAAASSITDAAGNALAADANDTWLLNPPSTFIGTANADTYEFIAAGGVGGLPTMHRLRVTLFGTPMATYLYDAAGPVSLSIDAKAGSDKLTITGGPGTDTTVINRYYVQHTGPGATTAPGYYYVYGSSMETIIDNAGAGTAQRSTFNDSPDNGDVFTASAHYRTGSMRSAAGSLNVYNNSSTGYDQIYGIAGNGGINDIAYLYDSDGNDYYVSKAGAMVNPISYIQRSSGGTGTAVFVTAVSGFETVYGMATAGGVDEAVLFGSNGDDSMRFEPGYTSGGMVFSRVYMTRPGGYFIYAQNFKKVTGYPEDGNDQVAFFDTAQSDVFTASPTDARLTGPAGSNILNIATTDLVNPNYRWDTVRAYSQVGGYDKAYLTGSTGADTFLGYGKPRAVYPGMGRLSGSGYFLEVYHFEEVYANLLTGNDTANLYDGTANDYFWAKLGAAVLTDGTVSDATGDLVTPNTYYYRVYGFDSAASDHVNAYGTSGGTNTKRVITPLDYVLATYGSWTDAP